jgi:hypothetical protein
MTIINIISMKKEWLWGPGRIDPDHKGLSKQEYLERLADIRDMYLDKLLRNLKQEDIPYIRRIEQARYAMLAEFDQVSQIEFNRPNKQVIPCTNCPNEESCEVKGVCNNWSLADFAAHLLTHEEKNIDPEVNETLPHMADHDETHLLQIRDIVSKIHKTSKKDKLTK